MNVVKLISEAYNQQINIIVAGAGGTGSLLLHILARMAIAIKDTRNINLRVVVFDHDTITASNVGRQCYTEYDIGRHKVSVLVERINRYYGLKWTAIPDKFPEINKERKPGANIIISCTDSVKSRQEIEDYLQWLKTQYTAEHADRFAYWLDCGNNYDNGNVILTDLSGLPPVSAYMSKKKPVTQRATCSLAVALGRQHFMVNNWAANIAGTILWSMLYDHNIDVHAAFYNVKTLQTRTIKADKYETDFNREEPVMDDIQIGE